MSVRREGGSLDSLASAVEACRIAREYSTAVIILSDQVIVSRIEAEL